MFEITRRDVIRGTAAMGAAVTLGPGLALAVDAPPPPVLAEPYAPRGVGGGGAFIGLSMSPYQRLWFVATDMATLFRSTDEGASWQAVPNTRTVFLRQLNGQDYPDLPGIGYSATPNVVFHAPADAKPLRSLDAGLTWRPMPLGDDHLRVRFWHPDSGRPGRVYAGLDDGFAVTDDDGVSWTRLAQSMGRARGLFPDPLTDALYVAFADGVHVSFDGGATFSLAAPATGLHRFAAGRKGSSLVFAYVRNPREGGEVFIGHPSAMAPATANGAPLVGAEHVLMAENDDTVYVAGWRGLPNQAGTNVWRSRGGGEFVRVFSQTGKGYGQSPWPTLQPSAVGLDIGYWDGGYHTFAVNQRNSSLVGGGGNFFLHMSKDGGATWLSPFTKPVEKTPGAGQAWRSTGLEDVSIRKVAFSPVDPRFGVACGCDYAMLITEDGGLSWRIATDKGLWGRKVAPFNSSYDVVFDPADPSRMIVAMSMRHDFQRWGNLGRIVPKDAYGGVFSVSDRGRRFERLGPDTPEARMSFLCLARDPGTGAIYAGTQGAGVAVMDASGANWRWLNDGFLDPAAIVMQIEVDARTGDAYALVGSDPSAPPETWAHSGLYRLQRGGDRWRPLRGKPAIPPPPAAGEAFRLMAYPTSFALIRDEAGAVSGYFLTDAEHCGAYLGTGLWRSDDDGANWRLVQQYTLCQTVVIDPADPRRVYLSGDWPGWGLGGAMYSVDGGETFRVNEAFPIQYSIWSVTPDPNDRRKIFYSCFGGGIRHGDKPGHTTVTRSRNPGRDATSLTKADPR